ncbi:MAG: NAD-dependent epimerase/dehydratase family protein [Candidatus Binataceae bacterium]
MNPKRILLTGATGFIGQHCLPMLLARGFEVHAVSFKREQLTLDGVRWHRANLLDAASIHELVRSILPTHLLHFAWFLSPGAYQSAENLRWAQAGIDMLLAFAAFGGERAVFAGTCFEYDLRRGYCCEDLTPCAPATRYGQCKLSLAHLVTRCPPDGLRTAWGRIFYLYGPHEPSARLVPSVILSLLRGEHARCTQGRQVRDYLHVEDVARAFVALVESDVRGVVNIASGEPITIRSICGRIAALLGAPQSVDFGAIEASPDDPAVVLAATSKLRGEIGWTPRWSLDDGLAATIAWWKVHAGLPGAR